MQFRLTQTFASSPSRSSRTLLPSLAPSFPLSGSSKSSKYISNHKENIVSLYCKRSASTIANKDQVRPSDLVELETLRRHRIPFCRSPPPLLTEFL